MGRLSGFILQTTLKCWHLVPKKNSAQNCSHLKSDALSFDPFIDSKMKIILYSEYNEWEITAQQLSMDYSFYKEKNYTR